MRVGLDLRRASARLRRWVTTEAATRCKAAWLLAGVAAVLLAAGVRALGAGMPVLGCLALGGAIVAMIAGVALAVGRLEA